MNHKNSMHTMEYDSAVKENEITNFAAAQMELEKNTVSKVAQTEKGKHHVFFLIWSATPTDVHAWPGVTAKHRKIVRDRWRGGAWGSNGEETSRERVV